MLKNYVSRRIAGLLLGLVIVIGAACTDETPGGGLEASQTPGRTPESGPSSLLYIDGRTLMRFDIGGGEHERLKRLPSADVAVSPDGMRYVVVEETAGRPNPDEYVEPRLRLGEVDGAGEPTDLGPGSTPRWSHDGKRVAAVVDSGGFICGSKARIQEGTEEPPEGCVPAEQIVSFPAEEGAGKATIVLGPTPGWSLLGFTDGNRVGAVVDGRGVVIGAPEGQGEQIPLGYKASEVWDVSPAELKLLVVQERSTFFVTPGEGVGPPLALDGAVLGDGTWSPDGRRVAAVLLAGGAGDARLGLIDVDTNEIEVVPESDGAQGNVVWGPAGSFAYTRTDLERPTRLQAVVCSEDLTCRETFSWRRGVSLLAVEEPAPATP